MSRVTIVFEIKGYISLTYMTLLDLKVEIYFNCSIYFSVLRRTIGKPVDSLKVL